MSESRDKESEEEEEEEEKEEKAKDSSGKGKLPSSSEPVVATEHQKGCGEEDACVPLKKRKYLHRLTQDQDQDEDQTPIDVTPGGHVQNPIVIDDNSELKTRKPLETESDKKELKGIANANKKGISIADSRQEIFLFQKQLEPGDIRHGRLDIPWETAEKYFPPHTEPYETESILVSDHQNTNWPMKVLNNPRTRSYKFMFGWNEFVEAHNLEPMDVVTFHRPIQPSQNYHYLITYAKAAEMAKAESDEKPPPVHTNKMGDLYSPTLTKARANVAGLNLDYLFHKELTIMDVSENMLHIPTMKAERHFPPLKKPDGSYNEEVLLVSDAQQRKWWMKIGFYPTAEAYAITGSWSEFVAEHGLQDPDVVHFFKVIKPIPVKHFFIDYERANKGDSSINRGSSQKLGHGGLSLSGGYKGKGLSDGN